MTYQEASQMFQKIFDNRQYLSRFKGFTLSEDTLKLAILALEKQIPKKPDYEGDGYDDSGNLIYDTWFCPNCNKDYEVYYDDYKFCPNCGQAIDMKLETI